MSENPQSPAVRTGQAEFPVSRAEFARKAGAEFADPDYDLSVDWLPARAAQPARRLQ